MKCALGVRLASLAVASAAVFALTSVGFGRAAAGEKKEQKEEKVAVKDLPEAVVKAIQDRFPGATILEAEKETENGQVVYEVDIKHDGTEYEVEVTEAGKIVEVERDDGDAEGGEDDGDGDDDGDDDGDEDGDDDGDDADDASDDRD